MNTRTSKLLFIASVLLALQPAMAGAWQRGGGHYYRSGHYRNGPSPRFYGHAWYGGHWYHGWYGGNPGWWWLVGSTWYLYPDAVYPYPDPTTVPLASIPAPPGPIAPFWYWCASPVGYYPYVSQCSQSWQPVAAGVPVDPAAAATGYAPPAEPSALSVQPPAEPVPVAPSPP